LFFHFLSSLSKFFIGPGFVDLPDLILSVYLDEGNMVFKIFIDF